MVSVSASLDFCFFALPREADFFAEDGPAPTGGSATSSWLYLVPLMNAAEARPDLGEAWYVHSPEDQMR